MAMRYRRILAIDIGATGLKAAIIGPRGGFLQGKLRMKTPHPCPPKVLIAALLELVKPLSRFDCVTIGFPGYVKRGMRLPPASSGPSWPALIVRTIDR